jgi:hypothetical protein
LLLREHSRYLLHSNNQHFPACIYALGYVLRLTSESIIGGQDFRQFGPLIWVKQQLKKFLFKKFKKIRLNVKAVTKLACTAAKIPGHISSSNYTVYFEVDPKFFFHYTTLLNGFKRFLFFASHDIKANIIGQIDKVLAKQYNLLFCV